MKIISSSNLKARESIEATGKIDDSFLKKVLAEFDFIQAIIEWILNSLDAKADKITLILERDGNGQIVKIAKLANGSGISKQKMSEALPAIFKSFSAEEKDKAGLNGIGSKGFGRHAQVYDVVSKPIDDPNIYAIRFTMTELADHLAERKKILIHTLDQKLIKNHPLITSKFASGTYEVWENVGKNLPGETWIAESEERSLDILLRKLPKHISKKDLGKITIVDGDKQYKLEVPKPSGIHIHEKSKVGELEGCEYDICLTNSLEDEEVQVSGTLTICSLRDFLKLFETNGYNTKDVKKINRVLCHHQVVGKVTIPELNKYRANNSKGIISDFFAKEERVIALINWLKTIVAVIEKKLGITNSNENAENDKFIDELTLQMRILTNTQNVEMVSAPETPETPATPPTTPAVLKTFISPTEMTLEYGQTGYISINNPKDGKQYNWRPENLPGVTGEVAGKKIRITIPSSAKEMEGSIIVEENGKRIGEANISVIERLPFEFSKNLYRLERNTTTEIQVSGSPQYRPTKLVWKLETQDGKNPPTTIKLEAGKDLFSQKITTDATDAIYKLTVLDADNPSISATTHLQVREKKINSMPVEEGSAPNVTQSEPARTTTIDQSFFRFLDHTFRIRPLHHDSKNEKPCELVSGPIETTIYVNSKHRLLGKKNRHEVAQNFIAMYLAEYATKGKTVARYMEIFTGVITAMHDRTLDTFCLPTEK